MRDRNKQRTVFAEQCLSQANALRLAGQTEEARQRLKALLSVWPENKAANLAMAQLSGQNENRLSNLQLATQKDPTNFAVWSLYIFELRMAGQKIKARKAAQKAKVSPAQRKELKLIADGRSAPLNDIVKLINDGAPALAWTTGTARLRHFPQDHRLLNLLGVAALKDDDTHGAENVLRKALSFAPNYDPARANLGYVLLRQNRATDAIDLLKGAAQKTDAALDISVNLAIAYWMAGLLPEADALSCALMSEAPDDIEVVGIRAKTLVALDQAAHAISILDPFAQKKNSGLEDVIALAIKAESGLKAALAYIDGLEPISDVTQARLVALMAEWGALEQATAQARQLVQNNPMDVASFRMIGLLSKWNPSDPLIKQMKETLDSPALSLPKRGTLGFVYASALADQNDHVAAMEALNKANGDLRTLFNYNVAIDEALMTEIAQCWNQSAIAITTTEFDHISPIFIVGLPRSGSTLLETILSCHPDVAFLGESPIAFSAASTARLKPQSDAVLSVAKSLSETLTPETDRGVVTDKLLANFLNVGVLAAAFPKARFIAMKRDYRATCLSIYRADLGRAAHPYSMNLEELARYAVAHDRLMVHWDNVLSSRMINVVYEKLVSQPHEEIPQLLNSLNLAPNEACLFPERSERSINTMSVAQARQPISTSSIASWKDFEGGLKPLTDILAKNKLI